MDPVELENTRRHLKYFSISLGVSLLAVSTADLRKYAPQVLGHEPLTPGIATWLKEACSEEVCGSMIDKDYALRNVTLDVYDDVQVILALRPCIYEKRTVVEGVLVYHPYCTEADWFSPRAMEGMRLLELQLVAVRPLSIKGLGRLLIGMCLFICATEYPVFNGVLLEPLVDENKDNSTSRRQLANLRETKHFQLYESLGFHLRRRYESGTLTPFRAHLTQDYETMAMIWSLTWHGKLLAWVREHLYLPPEYIAVMDA